MIYIILSLGTVYAFIPVIIVIILLLAARGSIGRDFFEMFGFATLVQSARGIGGGGAGRGISRSGAYTSTDLSKQAGGINKIVGSPLREKTKVPVKNGKAYKYSNAFRKGGMWKVYMDSKKKLLTSPGGFAGNKNEIMKMLDHYGLGAKAANIAENPNGSIENLVTFATYELSLREIKDYYKKNIQPRKAGPPPAAQNPKRMPTTTGGKIKMAVGTIGGFYWNYSKSRVKRPMSHAEDTKIVSLVSTMTSDDIVKMLGTYHVRVPADMDRERLTNLVRIRLSSKQIENYIASKKSGDNGESKTQEERANELQMQQQKRLKDLRETHRDELGDLNNEQDAEEQGLAIDHVIEANRMRDTQKKEMDELKKKHEDELKNIKGGKGQPKVTDTVFVKTKDGGYYRAKTDKEAMDEVLEKHKKELDDLEKKQEAEERKNNKRWDKETKMMKRRHRAQSKALRGRHKGELNKMRKKFKEETDALENEKQ